MKLTIEDAQIKIRNAVAHCSTATLANVLAVATASKTEADGDSGIYYEPDKQMPHVLVGDDNMEFDVPQRLALDGFWLTVGDASIKIRKTDEGVVVDIYAKGKEDDEAVAACYAYDTELKDDET